MRSACWSLGGRGREGCEDAGISACDAMLACLNALWTLPVFGEGIRCVLRVCSWCAVGEGMVIRFVEFSSVVHTHAFVLGSTPHHSACSRSSGTPSRVIFFLSFLLRAPCTALHRSQKVGTGSLRSMVCDKDSFVGCRQLPHILRAGGMCCSSGSIYIPSRLKYMRRLRFLLARASHQPRQCNETPCPTVAPSIADKTTARY